MNDRAKPFVTLLLTVAVLIAYVNAAPWLNQRGCCNSGWTKATTPPGLVVPTVDEQVRGGAKTWTQEAYLLEQFPDIRNYVNEQQYRVLLDRSVPGQAKDLIIANAGRRKRGEPVEDPYSPTKEDGTLKPEFVPGFEGDILRYQLRLQNKKVGRPED